MYDREGEPLTPDDLRLFGRYQRPLPASALSVVPAVDKPKISPEERKRRVAELKQKVRDGVVAIQQSDEFRNYLLAMARFHDYSWHNTMLIIMQRPDATLIRGFHGWKELGRSVKKGEIGMRILAPSGPTSETRWERVTDGKTWHIRRAGKDWNVVEARSGRVERTFTTWKKAAQWLRDEGAIAHKNIVSVERFVDVSVFDIKQTEGKPIPEFHVPAMSGAMNRELFDNTMALLKKRGVTVDFDSRPDMAPGTKGFFRHPDFIWVRPEEAPAQQLKTLLHEAAHYYSMGPFKLTRADAETIAESTAFVVAAHHGFDTGAYTFPYVALWAKNDEVMRRNLEGIQKVSEHIIDELEDMEVRDPRRFIKPLEPVAMEPGPAPTPPPPSPRPTPPVTPPPPITPRMTLQELEENYSLAQIKQMAQEKNLSTAGSKRDIIKRLL